MKNFCESLNYSCDYVFSDNDVKSLAVQLSRDAEINTLIKSFVFNSSLLSYKLNPNHEKTIQVFLNLVQERIR